MLTDERDKLEFLEPKDDESPGTKDQVLLLPDTKQTADLLTETVIFGTPQEVQSLIFRNANINSQYLETSLLATAIMNKKTLIVEWLLRITYLVTKVDLEELGELIGELKRIKSSAELDEENKAELKVGLAILHAFKEEIQAHHFKMINDKISDIKAEINAVIVELLLPFATTNNTVKAAATATVANPPPLLHAFQDVHAFTTLTNTLFSLIDNQEFAKFSFLLNKLINQNVIFDINAADKDGKTLLHHASINLDNRFLKTLLENKANPNIGDKYGWTPVHWAAFTGNNFGIFMENATFELIDWKTKTKRHETILHLAEKGKKLSKEDLDVICTKVSNTELKNLTVY